MPALLMDDCRTRIDSRYEAQCKSLLALMEKRSVDTHEVPHFKKSFGDCSSSISGSANDEDVCFGHVRECFELADEFVSHCDECKAI